ncbi:hypothetical protein ACW9UM_17680 (plasmid) [Marinovum sp. KMM 9989]
MASIPPSMARLLRLAHRQLARQVALRAGRRGLALAAICVALACLITWLLAPLPREVTFAVALSAGGALALMIWFRARPDMRAAANLVDDWAGQPDLARSALAAPRGGLAGAYLAQVEQAAARVLTAPPRATDDPQASVWAVSALVLALGFGVLPPVSGQPGTQVLKGSSSGSPQATQDSARKALSLADALFPVEFKADDTADMRAVPGQATASGGSGTTSDLRAGGMTGGHTEIVKPLDTGDSIALPGGALAGDATPLAAPLSGDVKVLAPIVPKAARRITTPAPLADLMPEQRRLIRRYQTLQ